MFCNKIVVRIRRSWKLYVFNVLVGSTRVCVCVCVYIYFIVKCYVDNIKTTLINITHWLLYLN